MRALVHIEMREGKPTEDALGIVGRAAGLGSETLAVICDASPGNAAELAARAGASRVLVANDARFEAPLAAPRAQLIEELARAHSVSAILLSGTVTGTEIAGILAARLEAGLAWSLSDIALDGDRLVGLRLNPNGKTQAKTIWQTPLQIASFRPGCFVFEPGENVAETEPVVPTGVLDTGLVAVERVLSDGGDQALATARVIVSGGRGVGKAENLEVVRDLAAALGGVAGVSLPLVELGWAPRSMQVGQTGTVVRPQLYVACGISGQIQHKIGIERAGKIVAINTDRDAPIMSFCDLGVIGDAVDLAARLAERLRMHGT